MKSYSLQLYRLLKFTKDYVSRYGARGLVSRLRHVYRTGHFLTYAKIIAGGTRVASAASMALSVVATDKKTDWDHTFAFKNFEGATHARRPKNIHDFAIKVPIIIARDQEIPSDVAIVIHAFYTEIVSEITSLLKSIQAEFKLYISTTSETKKKIISGILQDSNISNAEIRIFENRGRDIAPKIVGFRDVYDNHEFFLHLHTKKSLHSGGLEEWRSYLYRNLIGSTDIVKSVFYLFKDEDIGIIFPQHFPDLRGSLNWGHDFDTAKSYLHRIGANISKDGILDFPSGSMFWGRSAAIRPLLDLDLKFEDFPDEQGQVDGTLAHAVERSYLYFAESAGFKWVKTHDGVNYPWPETLLSGESPNLQSSLRQVWRPLSQIHGSRDFAIARVYPELRPLNLIWSNSPVHRLNLLVPTLRPESIFGGISTALKIFFEIGERLPASDLRIVVLDTELSDSHIAAYSGYKIISPSDVETPRCAVTCVFDRREPLDIRENDSFVSTAWWSECLRWSIRDFQSAYGKRKAKHIYLIQDYEPNFAQWSSKWALAEATYNIDNDTTAIVNSEELSVYMDSYRLGDFFTIKYELNKAIKRLFPKRNKEKIILCYGRPSVARNCFEIVVDGICHWQQNNPTTALDWRVVFAGEDFPVNWAYPVQNASVSGKLNLDEYADLLARASVGVSLMLSPHPSYPPLEMASAGIRTISNNYRTKRISDRSNLITGLDFLSPTKLAEALEIAVAETDGSVEATGQLRSIAMLPYKGVLYDPALVADRLVC